MSRLWPERILVSLEAAALGWVRRGERASVEVRPASGQEPWQGAVEALRKQAAAWGTHRAHVHVVLSNLFVRYLVVPAGGSGSATEQSALARFHFSRVHGERALGWEARLTTAPDSLQVGCAIDRALLEALKSCFAPGSRVRLRSVQPYLMSAYNRWRARIPREGAWLVLQEPGRVCVAALGERGWLALATGHDGDWRALLMRERLRMRERAAPPTMLMHPGVHRDLLPVDDVPTLEKLAA